MSGAHPSVVRPFRRIVRERRILRRLIVPGLMFLSIALLSAGLTLLRQSPTGTTSDTKRTAPDAGKVLHVEPAELDVGMVWAEPGFHHRFRLQNSSRAPVVVERVAADCDCTHVSPASFSLGPGAAQTIDIDIDLARLANGGDSRTRKVLDTTLGFVLSDGRIENFQVHGTATFAFSAPSTILIGAPLVFGEPADAERFTI